MKVRGQYSFFRDGRGIAKDERRPQVEILLDRKKFPLKAHTLEVLELPKEILVDNHLVYCTSVRLLQNIQEKLTSYIEHQRHVIRLTST